MSYSEKYPEPVAKRVKQLCDEHRTVKDIADTLTRETGREYLPKSVRAYMKNHRITNGTGGCKFKKGNIPHTKGKKWDDYMSKDAQERSRATCYKKGDKPWNMVPVGTRIVRQSDNKAWIKFKEEDERGSRFCWKPEDRLVYEAETGNEIPEGMTVLHKNGDTLDCRFENLIVVPDAEATSILNRGLLSEDPEIMEAALATARIAVRANELTEMRRERKRRMKKNAEQN